MVTRWYVLRTKPQAEYASAAELDKDGFEVFFPRIKADISRRGHGDVPLFQGYIFVKCDLGSDNWPTFRQAHRTLGWIKFGDEISWVPDPVISELKERLDTIERQGGIRNRFQPGEKVWIDSGHVQSIGEVIEELSVSNGNIHVLMEFMGRLVSAKVPAVCVQPLSDDADVRNRRTRGRGRWVRGFGPRALAGA